VIRHNYRREAEGFNAETIEMNVHTGTRRRALPLRSGRAAGRPDAARGVRGAGVPEELLGRRAFLTAFPILLAGCGGAPARAVAWEIEES
jgi:kynurenine formamidase